MTMTMTVSEYKAAVVRLFGSGKATEAQWDEMATAVLHCSEMDGSMEEIDAEIYPAETQGEENSSHNKTRAWILLG